MFIKAYFLTCLKKLSLLILLFLHHFYFFLIFFCLDKKSPQRAARAVWQEEKYHGRKEEACSHDAWTEGGLPRRKEGEGQRNSEAKDGGKSERREETIWSKQHVSLIEIIKKSPF